MHIYRLTINIHDLSPLCSKNCQRCRCSCRLLTPIEPHTLQEPFSFFEVMSFKILMFWMSIARSEKSILNGENWLCGTPRSYYIVASDLNFVTSPLMLWTVCDTLHAFNVPILLRQNWNRLVLASLSRSRLADVSSIHIKRTDINVYSAFKHATDPSWRPGHNGLVRCLPSCLESAINTRAPPP